MSLRNTESRWGTVAKVFHWTIAVGVLFSLAYGWWMTHLSERAMRLDFYGMHASWGYDLLFLLLLRVAWRAYDRAPLPLPDSARWERIAAQAGHAALYFLTIAVCVAGWLMSGAMRRPLQQDLFGVLPVPAPDVARGLHDTFEDVHKILAYALLALIVVHVAAALRHHYVKKNDVLRRML